VSSSSFAAIPHFLDPCPCSCCHVSVLVQSRPDALRTYPPQPHAQSPASFSAHPPCGSWNHHPTLPCLRKDCRYIVQPRDTGLHTWPNHARAHWQPGETRTLSGSHIRSRTYPPQGPSSHLHVRDSAPLPPYAGLWLPRSVPLHGLSFFFLFKRIIHARLLGKSIAEQEAKKKKKRSRLDNPSPFSSPSYLSLIPSSCLALVYLARVRFSYWPRSPTAKASPC
jgi:hypothetical protein